MTTQTKKRRRTLTRWFTQKPEHKETRVRWYAVENCGIH
jgi:hypothetical protein